MRKLSLSGLLVSLSFFLLPLPSYSQATTTGLVAEPYPGSVPEASPAATVPGADVTAESRLRVFYTKDPAEKVKSYYSKLGTFDGDAVSVVPSKEIFAILGKKGVKVGEDTDSIGGAFAGVTVYGKSPGSSYAVTQALEGLQSGYLMKFSNEDPMGVSKHLEDPAYKQMAARYEPLKSSYFQRTDQKSKQHPQVNAMADEVIYDKYFSNPQERLAKEQQELAAKMTTLMTQGKYDEAKKIGDRLTQIIQMPMDGKANLDTAIQCLQEMESNAYATKIVIDMHPSKWDFSASKQK